MPTDRPMLSPYQVRQLLTLDHKSGHLYWKHRDPIWFNGAPALRVATSRMWNKKFAGKRAFTARTERGYMRGNILNRTYEAARVVYAIATGSWPLGEIDHINGDPTDNRPENLRVADRTMQTRNMAMPRTNSSGVVGVSWDSNRKRWAAFIHLNNKIRHLGRFKDFSEAVRARKTAERQHGFHPNHGRRAA